MHLFAIFNFQNEKNKNDQSSLSCSGPASPSSCRVPRNGQICLDQRAQEQGDGWVEEVVRWNYSGDDKESGQSGQKTCQVGTTTCGPCSTCWSSLPTGSCPGGRSKTRSRSTWLTLNSFIFLSFFVSLYFWIKEEHIFSSTFAHRPFQEQEYDHRIWIDLMVIFLLVVDIFQQFLFWMSGWSDEGEVRPPAAVETSPLRLQAVHGTSPSARICR